MARPDLRRSDEMRKVGDTEVPSGMDYKWVHFMVNDLNASPDYNYTYGGSTSTGSLAVPAVVMAGKENLVSKVQGATPVAGQILGSGNLRQAVKLGVRFHG